LSDEEWVGGGLFACRAVTISRGLQEKQSMDGSGGSAPSRRPESKN